MIDRRMIPLLPIIPMTLVDDMGKLEIIMLTRLLFRALVAVVQAGFGHAFSKASLFDEFFLQRLQLLIQQIIRSLGIVPKFPAL